MGRIVIALLLAGCLVSAALAAEAKTCVVCKKVFTNQADYIQHIRSHLGAKQPTEPASAPAVAKTPRAVARSSTPPPKIAYARKITLPALHSAISAGSTVPVRADIPSFSCPYCSKQVVSHLGMLLHLQWHKGSRARRAPAVEAVKAPKEEPPAEEPPAPEETGESPPSPPVEATPPAKDAKPAEKAPATKSPSAKAPAKKGATEDDVLSVLDE